MWDWTVSGGAGDVHRVHRFSDDDIAHGFGALLPALPAAGLLGALAIMLLAIMLAPRTPMVGVEPFRQPVEAWSLE